MLPTLSLIPSHTLFAQPCENPSKNKMKCVWIFTSVYPCRDIQATIQKKVSQVTVLQEEIKDQEQNNLQLVQQLTASETKLQHIHQSWDLKQESLNKEIKEQKQ